MIAEAFALVQRGEPAASLEWFDKAITGLKAVLEAQPKLASARTFLRNSYDGRYQALRLLGRTDEALADVDRMLELSDGNPSPVARLARFEVLFGADRVRAMAELDRVVAEPSTTHETLYQVVVHLCHIAALCEDEERDTYGTRAVTLLEQLLARGSVASAMRSRTASFATSIAAAPLSVTAERELAEQGKWRAVPG